MNKKQLILGAVALILLGAFVAIGFRTSSPKTVPTQTDQSPWPSQEVDKVSINQNTDHYSIDAVYPKTVSDSISLYFKSYTEDQITEFKNDTSWVDDVESASSQSLTLDISYQFVPGANAQNYIFTTNSYTGGAHGMQTRRTFAFNKGGQLLTISNLFSNGIDGLNAFSKLVQKELLKREGADEAWIADGAGPKEENYSTFVINDDGVTVLFDPYQVAPYSDGAIDITIPLTAFKNIANTAIFSIAQ